MRTNIVKIGNSQGIRIPKVFLEQLQLGSEVDLAIEDNRLVIQSPSVPRAGWADSFRSMAEASDDRLLNESMNPTQWDEEEWQW